MRRRVRPQAFEGGPDLPDEERNLFAAALSVVAAALRSGNHEVVVEELIKVAAREKVAAIQKMRQ